MRRTSNIFASRINALVFVYTLLFSTSINAAPLWVTEHDSDDSIIASVGIGETLDKAKENALSNIANSLSSQVSTSLESKLVTESKLSINQRTESYTSISSKNIVLSTVYWTHTASEDGVYYVKGGVKLVEWVALTQQRFMNAMLPITTLSSKPQWSLIDYQQSLALDLQELQQLSLMLSPYVTNAHDYQATLNRLKIKQGDFSSNQCFTLKRNHDSLAEKYFKPVLENALRKENLVVSNSSHCHSVSFISRNDKVNKNTLKTSFLIQISDYDDYKLDVEGTGQSYKSQLMSVADNLSKELEQQGGILKNP